MRARPRDLLLITSAFPYRPEFLDVEINYLADRFERVTVAPLRPTGTECCSLPANVEVNLGLARRVTPALLLPQLSGRVQRNVGRAIALGSSWRSREMWADVRAARRPGTPSWLQSVAVAHSTARTLQQWAKARNPPSLAYTYWLGSSVVGLRQAWPGVPIASRAHRGDVYPEAPIPGRLPLQEAAVVGADAIYAVSRHGCDYLRQRYPAHAEKIQHYRLGCANLGGLTPASGDGVLRVVSVSSVRPVKQVDRVAEAVGIVARTGREIEWTHIGAGPGEAELDRALHQARTERLTVKRMGALPLAQVHAVLAEGPFDVFVNYSASEGVPVSLMEAQSAGIPIVATTVGGTPEVLTSHDQGLPAHVSPMEFAAAVIRASVLPWHLRAQKREFWRKHYDANRNSAAFSASLAGMARFH